MTTYFFARNVPHLSVIMKKHIYKQKMMHTQWLQKHTFQILENLSSFVILESWNPPIILYDLVENFFAINFVVLLIFFLFFFLKKLSPTNWRVSFTLAFIQTSRDMLILRVYWELVPKNDIDCNISFCNISWNGRRLQTWCFIWILISDFLIICFATVQRN